MSDAIGLVTDILGAIPTDGTWRGLGVRAWECRRTGCQTLCWFLDGRVRHGDGEAVLSPAVTGDPLTAWLRQVHAYEAGRLID